MTSPSTHATAASARSSGAPGTSRPTRRGERYGSSSPADTDRPTYRALLTRARTCRALSSVRARFGEPTHMLQNLCLRVRRETLWYLPGLQEAGRPAAEMRGNKRGYGVPGVLLDGAPYIARRSKGPSPSAIAKFFTDHGKAGSTVHRTDPIIEVHD